MGEDYWDGGTWIYQSVITNDADGSGTISVEVSPGVGNEMELLYGDVQNGDASARIPRVRIRASGDEVLASLIDDASLGVGSRMSFPTTVGPSANTESSVGPGARLIISGTMILFVSVEAVAVSQDAAFGIACRIRGGLPTVTETGNGTTPVIAIAHEGPP